MVFDEKKLINIFLIFLGTIGHVDHGKTTLTAAITKGKKTCLKNIQPVHSKYWLGFFI